MSLKYATAERYFIGATTEIGYVSLSEDFFEKCERLYIIKGAPGTGKSHFLTRIAESAGDPDTVLLLCSSDPSSLDGVFFPKSRTLITDGTSPHARDTVLPGARDSIIDLGAFWNGDVLIENRLAIEKLMQEKNRAYSRIFSVLGSLKGIRIAEDSILSEHLDTEKLLSAASRLVKKAGGEKGITSPRQTDAISMEGIVHLDTLERLSTEQIGVTGRHGEGLLFLSALLDEAKRTGTKAYYSSDPLSGMAVSSILFPGTGTLVRLSGDEEEKKIVNMDRFIRPSSLSGIRKLLRTLDRLREESSVLVADLFGSVSSAHFALEKIYGSSMDFPALDAFTDDFVSRLSSRRS